jgi:hypothetical protein
MQVGLADTKSNFAPVLKIPKAAEEVWIIPHSPLTNLPSGSLVRPP